jgi:hypothetical protein
VDPRASGDDWRALRAENARRNGLASHEGNE